MEGIESLPTWAQVLINLAVLLVAVGAGAYGRFHRPGKKDESIAIPVANSLPQQMVVQQAIERAVLEQEIKGNQVAMLQKLERLHEEVDCLCRIVNGTRQRVDDIWQEIHDRKPPRSGR